MKIYIGADHNGFALKSQLIEYLASANYDVVDSGDDHYDADDDFPEFAGRVAAAVLASDDKDPRGILICGSGQGMCMAANRMRGIRAALCWNRKSAREARNDDNSNVLCLPGHVLNKKEGQLVVETWLNTPFAHAPRFIRRLKQIDQL